MFSAKEHSLSFLGKQQGYLDFVTNGTFFLTVVVSLYDDQVCKPFCWVNLVWWYCKHWKLCKYFFDHSNGQLSCCQSLLLFWNPVHLDFRRGYKTIAQQTCFASLWYRLTIWQWYDVEKLKIWLEGSDVLKPEKDVRRETWLENTNVLLLGWNTLQMWKIYSVHQDLFRFFG